MEFLTNHWDEILEIIGAALGLASMITALTPTPKDDAVVHKILDFFSVLKPFTAKGTLKLPLTRTKK